MDESFPKGPLAALGVTVERALGVTVERALGVTARRALEVTAQPALGVRSSAVASFRAKRGIPFASLALSLLIALPARAHDAAGLHHLRPGMPFNFYAMKAVLPGPGGPTRGEVDFTPLRGSALAFLVIDPFLPRDIAEARRFEKLARRLPGTRAFLVALPQRSLLPAKLVEAAAKEKLELPLLIDERDIFPYTFGFPLTVSPRYELFDRSGTLILQNAARLSQRLPTGLTVELALEQLDRGDPVEPMALTARADRAR